MTVSNYGDSLPNPYVLREEDEKKKPKIAIILVPAIGASNLYEKGIKNSNSGYAPDNSVLMVRNYVTPPATKVANYLRKNALDWEPEQSDQYGWNQAYSGTYHDFLNDCQKYDKFPFKPFVYVIGYNFFQSNLQSANRIALRTKEILQKSKFDGFIYITHSMGALPVRAALKMVDIKHSTVSHQFLSIHKKCLGVIHVVAPNFGAPEAYIRFHRGVTMDNADVAEQYVLGRTGFDFAVKACFIPSMCEILPVREYAKQTIIAVKNDKQNGISALSNPLENLVKNVLSKQKSQFKKVDGLNEKVCLDSLKNNLQSAIKFHDFLGRYFYHSTRLVVVSGIPTVGIVNEKMQSKTVIGDGTVTLSSQKAAGNIDRQNIVEIVSDGKLKHGDTFNKVGKKNGVFNSIYDLLIDLYQTSRKSSLADSDTIPLSSELSALEVNKHPIFLNGQQAIFNKAVATTPVALEPKTTHR
ncbi:MAG: hypothetical protein F6J96_29395 [Symploca sp. SIO1C2]|nr:hypothetical protein [Symploca sp. SIO1C2]